jgi:hypothetical protein
MNENRRQILEMLAAGKITADEAERLITAIEPGSATDPGPATGRTGSAAATNGEVLPAKPRPKYLRVLVVADETMSGMKGGTTVNVRVPMQFLRAGVRLASLIPAQAHGQLDEAFSKHGVPITLSQIKPENLEELIDHLDDLTVDVDGNDGKAVKVRVFCE